MRALLLSVTLLVFLSGCPKGGDLPSPGPAPGNVPSTALQQTVKDIVPIEDKELASFYRDFADIIERDSEIIKTTGHIREANRRAGMLMFQKTSMKGKYPGLAEKVDSALMEVLGNKDVSLTPELRQKAVEIFRALSWAVD